MLVEGADALPLTVPIHTIDRPGERIEEVGLQTMEAKSVLGGLQQVLVRHQLPVYMLSGAMPFLDVTNAK